MCYTCKVTKPLDDFFKSSKDTLGHRYQCKECQRKAAQIRRKANPQAVARNYRRYTLKRDFGITPEIYDALLHAQGGVCRICGSKPTAEALCVDHNHQTGQVRGLLCKHCNLALGYFKEDTTRLLSACQYLNEYAPKHP